LSSKQRQQYFVNVSLYDGVQLIKVEQAQAEAEAQGQAEQSRTAEAGALFSLEFIVIHYLNRKISGKNNK
jgi:hypothetical protein